MSDDTATSPGLIRVHIHDLRQLFNSMDPSPFVERDLDPDAEEFIVEWAREMPSGLPLAIVIEVREEHASGEESALAREALGGNFDRAALAAGRRLHRLLGEGRLSLLIGLAALAMCLTLSAAVAADGGNPLRALTAEGLIIGGWVAMWRPMEIFLYEWWPIARERRLLRRLAAARIEVVAQRAAG